MLPSRAAAACLAALASSVRSATRTGAAASTPELTSLAGFATGPAQVAGQLQARGFAALASGAGKARTPLQEARAWLKICKQLSKARLSALVVSTTAVGFIAGSGECVDWRALGWTAAGTFGASACANALNQVWEVANDGRMRRTMARPLPAGRVSRPQALAFAAVAGVGGVWLLANKANGLTAALGAANIALYAGVYTPLKVVSAANTWVGALVGAIPPLMGWAAAAGALEPGAALLAAALYFWQLPHFFALAWLHREDYARGGYAMLPRFDPSGRRTAACALRNSLYMLPLGAMAAWAGVASAAFAVEATVAAGTLATTAAVFYQKPSQRSARLLFRFSLLFLPVFMAGLVAHRLPNDHSVTLPSLAARAAAGDWRLRSEPGGSGAAWPLEQLQAVPLPFLPVPLRVRCPAKAECEGGRLPGEEQPGA